MSSHESSCTNPTWFASMKHGSHIMLQRFVRSIVSTAPRPYLIVLVPWLWSFSSLWARMSLPGYESSRCLKNAVSIAITSSKWPCWGQSFTIRILPSRSMMVRLDLADLLVEQDLVVALAVEDLLARFANAGRAERVGLARPAERRLHLLPRLLNRLVGPLGREGLCPLHAVERVEYAPRAFGRERQPLLDVLDRLMHMPPQHSSRRRARAARAARTPIQQKNIGGPVLPCANSAKWAICGVNGRHAARAGAIRSGKAIENQALTC